MLVTNTLLEKLIQFRKALHQFPELSGLEKATAKNIAEFLKPSNPTKIISGIGGHGLAVVYDSEKPGPTVLLRADIDALPIEESNVFAYRSTVKGVAHLCGHDGHSAILAGVGYCLQQSKPKTGKVVLLFQPAEETGEGARLVINDEKFAEIKPDYSFALHNLPGFERGKVFLKEESFASASTGFIVKLKGLSSHAAHPEDGNNPDKAMAHIILKLNSIINAPGLFNDFALLTVIHAQLGEVAFGTTPGKGVVMSTLRTFSNSDMSILIKQVESVVKRISEEYSLSYEISYTEEFPATVNHIACVDIIKSAAISLSISTEQLSETFKWSEDFGHFTKISKAALFGIGSGVNHPQLHNEDYDFPDDIIAPSIKVFLQIVENILGTTTR